MNHAFDDQRSKENHYFLLNLRLPVPEELKHSILRGNNKCNTQQKVEDSTATTSLVTFEDHCAINSTFVTMLEKTFKCNLREKNPWLSSKSVEKTRKPKHVRFAALELYDNSLPNCRSTCERTIPGCLHAPSCINNHYETVAVLGQSSWQNRQMLMSFHQETSNHFRFGKR